MELEFKTGKKNVKIIDMSWYQKYKPYGDAVIGGMLYIFLAWRIFKNAPNIISGVGSSADTISKL